MTTKGQKWQESEFLKEVNQLLIKYGFTCVRKDEQYFVICSIDTKTSSIIVAQQIAAIRLETLTKSARFEKE